MPQEGLNLTVLLTTLVPAAMTKEEDELWTFESLLREITDELSDTPKTVISVTIPNSVPGNTSPVPGNNYLFSIVNLKNWF